MTKVLMSETMYMDNEVTNGFAPYAKTASRIDEVLGALNFTKMVGNTKEVIRLSSELNQLRSEISEIQQRNRRR